MTRSWMIAPRKTAYTRLPRLSKLAERVAQLEALVEQLQKTLEQARRSGKRQAAPFRKNKKNAPPKKPGRRVPLASRQCGCSLPVRSDSILTITDKIFSREMLDFWMIGINNLALFQK